MLDRPQQLEGLAFESRALKKARREGRVPPGRQLEQRWATIAGQAIEPIEAAPEGKRGSSLSDRAAGLGVKPTYLRQALTAYRFANSGAIKGVDLLTFPIGVVDDARRWSDVDAAAATKALTDLAKGKIDLDEFTALATKARKPATSRQALDWNASAFRAQVRKIAPELLPGFSRVTKAVGIAETCITLSTPDNAQRAVILVVGRYDDTVREVARSREALLQALGLLLSYEKVMLAYGSDGAAAHARSLLADLRPATGVVFEDKTVKDRISIWSDRELKAASAACSVTAQADLALAPGTIKIGARWGVSRPGRGSASSGDSSNARTRSLQSEVGVKKRAG